MILPVPSHQAASELSFHRIAEHPALAILDKLLLSRFPVTFGCSVEFRALFRSVESNRVMGQYL